MPIPPRFETFEDAGEFLLNHDSLTAVLTPYQYARFIDFVFSQSDGEASLPLLALEFFRLEIQLFDNLMSGD